MSHYLMPALLTALIAVLLLSGAAVAQLLNGMPNPSGVSSKFKLRLAWWMVCELFRNGALSLKMRAAWLLPRWLVYWAAIRMFSHASTGKYSDDEAADIDFNVALDRWNQE